MEDNRNVTMALIAQKAGMILKHEICLVLSYTGKNSLVMKIQGTF